MNSKAILFAACLFASLLRTGIAPALSPQAPAPRAQAQSPAIADPATRFVPQMVTTLNCLFDEGNWAPIRFKTRPSRGGVVENITYKDIVLHQTRQAFEMNMEWRMVGPRQPDSNPLPIVRNVRIVNVTGDVMSVGTIRGLAGSPIQGVTFEDCKISAQRGFRLDHARSVNLKGLAITVPQGDPVTTTDVQ